MLQGCLYHQNHNSQSMMCLNNHRIHENSSKVSEGPSCKDTKTNCRPTKEDDLQVIHHHNQSHHYPHSHNHHHVHDCDDQPE